MNVEGALQTVKSASNELRTPALFSLATDQLTEASRRVGKAAKSARTMGVWRRHHENKAIEALDQAVKLLRRAGNTDSAGLSVAGQVDALKAVAILEKATIPWIMHLGPNGQVPNRALATEIHLMSGTIRGLGAISQVRSEALQITRLAELPTVLAVSTTPVKAAAVVQPASAELVGKIQDAIASGPKMLTAG